MTRRPWPSNRSYRAAARLVALVQLLGAATGCFTEPDPVDPGAHDSTGSGSVSSGPGGPSGSGVDPSASSSGLDSTDAAPPTGSEGSSDTGPLPAACGDGVIAPGELCWGPPVTIEGGGPASDLHAAEVDGDGWLDLVVSVPIMATLFLGDGTGGFVVQPPFMTAESGNGGGTLALARLDAGDTIDLVASNGATWVTALLGDGGGGFGAPIPTVVPGVNPEGLLPGDYTNDGVTDVLVFRTSGYDVYFGVGQGNGTFAFTSQLAVMEPGPRAGGDFDGDGNLDAVIGQSTAQTLTWLRGTGTDAMTPQAVPFGRGFGYGQPAAGDVDGDGTDDVAFPLGDSDQVAVVLGAVGMGPTAPLLLDTTGEPAAAALADLDNDGTLDVASCGRGLFAALSVWRGDGAGGFAAVEELPITRCEHLAVGDFDGDGALDVAYHDSGPGGLHVILAEP